MSPRGTPRDARIYIDHASDRGALPVIAAGKWRLPEDATIDVDAFAEMATVEPVDGLCTDLYTPDRDGVVSVEPDAAPEKCAGSPLRCQCDQHRAERSRLRELSLIELRLEGETLKGKSWAYRPWDGPGQHFPGTTSSDLSDTSRTHPHRLHVVRQPPRPADHLT